MINRRDAVLNVINYLHAVGRLIKELPVAGAAFFEAASYNIKQYIKNS